MAVEALYWNPHETGKHVVTVADVTDLTALADELESRYEAAPGQFAAGVELRRGAGLESLSIGITRTGWALIHTNENMDQHCTIGDQRTDQSSVDVRWEEPTSVPASWFIPKEHAVQAVRQWLADGSLSEEVSWSDECY